MTTVHAALARAVSVNRTGSFRHYSHGGASHNARRRTPRGRPKAPPVTSADALRIADSLGDPIFDDSILEGPEVRSGCPWC